MAVHARVRALEPSEAEADVSERFSTSVPGLDALLEGGLPRGSSTVRETRARRILAGAAHDPSARGAA